VPISRRRRLGRRRHAPAYLLGTDEVGRDILSRLIHGARYSLSIGSSSSLIALDRRHHPGLLAGYFRGWVDVVIMRVMDIILAFPSLLLALVLVAILGPGLLNAMLAIALVLQPHFARLVRAAVMAEKNREYVTSAKMAGAGHIRLMFIDHSAQLPGAADRPGDAVLLQRHSRRGGARLPRHGRPAPDARMGHHAGQAPANSSSAPWIVTFPGLAILITVLAINLIGDGLRDALDPKLKRS
jgi:dipeptide transport system permease protein